MRTAAIAFLVVALAGCDTTGEYPDLCVWIQSDPKEKDKNLITSDECG